MQLSKKEIKDRFQIWLKAWDEYDLEGVLEFMHDDVVFENWDGVPVIGKPALQRSWTPWFIFNGGFKFISEDIFIDEQEQKLCFQWRLEWPSFEKEFKGKHESRRGVDVVHFSEGKIIKKCSYSQTLIKIDSKPVLLGVKNDSL